MRVAVLGLGVQGKKRVKIAGSEVVATVDPVHKEAQFKTIRDVPLESFDSALVCTPDEAKFEILEYLISNKKHLLVEKPLLGKDEAPLLHLQNLANKNKTVCYTAYNHRFEPHIVNLKSVIDSSILGKIYFVKFFYGNGTARDVRNSPWRDKGAGVLPDIGSHLLDTVLFLFGEQEWTFKKWSFDKFENLSYDRIIFNGQGKNLPSIDFEATLLSWRNTFRLDVFAENGSAHIDCLCKWGPSTFYLRKRVLPSGRPSEEKNVLECTDPTWQLEYDHFKNLTRTGESNLKNDIWINRILNELGRG